MPIAWPRRATIRLRDAGHDVAAASPTGQLLLVLLAAILFPLCLFYWQTRNDLIPDHIPIFGRLDDVGVIAGSLAILRQSAARLAALAPDFAENPPGLVLAFLRASTLGLLAGLATPILFRATLGTWPTPEARQRFTRGLRRRDVPLPPLLRALAETPAGTRQIRTLLQLIPPSRPGESLLPPPGAKPLTIPPLMGDPLAFWRGPDIGFLHIEKSAGTSILGTLTAQFHPAQIDPDLLRTMPPHALSRLPAQAAIARAHPLVWGHYDLPYLQSLGPERFLILFLRNPRTRILSLYHYWRSVKPEVLAREDGNHSVHLAQSLSLEAFLESADPLLVPYIDNIYTRRLIGHYEPVLPANALLLARQALRTVHFIGFTETIDSSLSALACQLGFPPPHSAPRANITQEIIYSDQRFRPAPPPTLTAKAESALTRLTALDQRLYAEARSLQAAKQADGIPPFS